MLLATLTFAVVALGQEAANVSSGVWTPQGALSEARAGACATQLMDGRVLITGGQGTSGALNSAELFAAGGSFTAAASMSASRSKHTCTLLEDGRVLVAGGENDIGPINLAEIYDPVTDQWSAAGDMNYARSGHTATLLPDGRVAIVGGRGAGSVQNTIEIFGSGPDTFTFVNTAALSSPRAGHGAALLSDGRLLLVGGSAGLDPLSSTEIFDPMTNTIAAGPRLLTARSGLTATTLLDGSVLVAGGSNGSRDLASAEILDPAAGRFVEAAAMSAPRSGHSAFLLPDNNQVLIVGGNDQTSAAELYTPWRGIFQPAGGLEEPLTAAAGAAVGQGGALVVAGGRSRTSRVLEDASEFGFPTLATDRTSYGPGTNVTVNGAGWQPGETVALTVQEVPKRRDVPPLTVRADESGRIEAQVSLVGQPVDTMNYVTAQAAASGAQIRFANIGANLDQCANGGDPAINTLCDAANEWVNGNLNGSKAHYLEGDSIPYRLVMSNVPIGPSHTVTIEWDTTQSGKHALDYITTYDRSQVADPCIGVSGCGMPTMFPIPEDPNVIGAGVMPAAGNFTLFGGTITGVSAYTLNGAYSGNSSTRITVTFTNTAASPVLAWGGHIATRLDWGEAVSAIAISGSPYHTRLIEFDGSGGNQDRSLSSDAAIFPVTIKIIKSATVQSSTKFDFTATPAPPLANFSLYDDGSTDDPDQTPSIKPFTITTFQKYTITENVPIGWSSAVTCGVTSPNGGSQSTTSNSAQLTVKEGENWTCTFRNTAQTVKLTLKKTLTPTDDAGRFDLKAGGTTVVSAAKDGDSGSTDITLTGANTMVGISEAASTGSLSNYTSTLSCDKGSFSANTGNQSGTLTIGLALAGSEITCTFGNTRNKHSLTLTKHVKPDGDTGTAKLNVTGATSADKGDGGSLTNPAVYGGTPVTVGETANPLYDPSGLACKAGGMTIPFNTGATATSGSFTMPDSDVTCDITNTRKAYQVSVKKVLVPSGDGGTFEIDLNGDLIGTLGHNQTASKTGITAGMSVTVSEAANTKYSSELICNYMDQGAVKQLGQGDETTSMTFTMPDANVSCTLTNTRGHYTVKLTKAVVPSDDPGTFTLTAQNVTQGGKKNGDSVSDANVYGGTTGVSVSEVADANYTTSLTCSGGITFGPSAVTSTTFTMPDANVDCTITNTRKPTLTITKVCAAAPGDNTVFTVNISPPMGQPAVDAGMVTCGSPGNTFTRVLSAGTYNVSETIPAGSTFLTPNPGPPLTWSLPSGWSAPGPFSGDCDASGNVTLGTTGNKTCYILNIQSYCAPSFLPVTMMPSHGAVTTAPRRSTPVRR